MACFEFFELDGNRGGDLNEDYAREYDRNYVARCNRADDGEVEIWAHPKCPKIRETKADWDPLAVCKSIKCKLRKGTRWTYDVTVKFSSLQFDLERKLNPLQERAVVTLDTELVAEERFTDRLGKPYTNTAGDLIKKVVEVPRSVLTVTKNISLFGGWIKNISGIVNSQPVRLKGVPWDAGTLKITKVSIGEDQERNQIGFMVCKIDIRHKEEGWKSVDLNVGYNELQLHPKTVYDPKTGKIKGKPKYVKVRCLTENGEPEPEMVFLDKKGRRPRETVDVNGVEYPVVKSILDPKEIVLLKWDDLQLFDFNNLPLK